MDVLSEIGAPTLAMASALTVAAGAYLNAKLAISTDMAQISNDRAFVRRVGERIAKLDGSATIYKMLERVVEVEGQGATDALWFEQKTWSYSQLKNREYHPFFGDHNSWPKADSENSQSLTEWLLC
jgi:hypothetical protein